MACHFGLKCLERNVALFFILQINLIEFYHKTLISKEHSEKLELLLINGVLTTIFKKKSIIIDTLLIPHCGNSLVTRVRKKK